MKSIKTIWVALIALFAPVKTMANEGGHDHKSMLYKLLGLDDKATDDMVNERFKQAMDCDDEDMAEKMKAANEAKVTAETLAANEKKAKTAAETAAANEKAAREKAEADLKAEKTRADGLATNFANERKERVKLALDAAVVGNKITGAQRKEYEAEFANESNFDATLAKLAAEKGTKLPAGRQAGMANIGSRKTGVSTPEDSKRREQIGQFVNEEMAKPQYKNMTNETRYSKAFTAVIESHPELAESKG